MNVEEVIAAADSFTTKELRALIDALVLIHADRSTDPSDRHLVAVHGILNRRLKGVPPYPLLMRSSAAAEFKGFVRAMEEFASRVSPTLSLPARLALYDLLVTLVIEWMKEVSIPLALTTVCRQGARLDGLVDRAFPGYLEAGLLGPLVLSRWAQPRKKN